MPAPDTDPGQVSRRLPEAVALFNSVFTSELLVHACWNKQQAGTEGLSWPAAFLILPLTLHPPTRDVLPRDTRLTLSAWAIRHPSLIADMDRRVAVMAQPTKRAIRRAIRAGRLGLEDAQLKALVRPRSPAADWPAEIRDAVRGARICGRWFNGMQTHLAFEMLGVGD
jgi:hypothetical protein